MSELKEKVQVVDCTPTWESLLPVFFAILEDGEQEGKDLVRAELTHMAQVADQHNVFVKEYKEEARNTIEKVLPLLKKTRLNFSKDESFNNVKEWEQAHLVIHQLREDLVTNIIEGK